MFCAVCGEGTTEASDLCAACQQEQLPDLVSVSAATTAVSQPGWYVDPSDAARQRYWNGSAWASTSHPANSFAYSTPAPLAPVAVPGMSFLPAVKSVLTKYVGFTGRARRSEYWWFGLFVVIAEMPMFFVLMVTSAASGATTDPTGLAMGGVNIVVLVVAELLLLALVLPHLAVTVRRLHDTNRSGWFYLINFVPLIGGIMLLVVLSEDSTRGPNRYGPSPKYV
jgi:uncharacterized membrane protein YhaH (DUF805 family)